MGGKNGEDGEMIPEMKKRMGATWVIQEEHTKLKWLIRCVHGDGLGIITTGDIEIVGKREWERWG